MKIVSRSVGVRKFWLRQRKVLKKQYLLTSFSMPKVMNYKTGLYKTLSTICSSYKMTLLTTLSCFQWQFLLPQICFLHELSSYCLELIMSSYYCQGKEVDANLINLPSSALGRDTGMGRRPTSFSDGYDWQVNNKHFAADIIIQER